MLEIKAEEFQSEVLNSGNVVLDFYSTECPPCEALAPKLDSLAALYGDHVKFVKIYRQESRALAETLGVKSSPTLLFFQKGKQLSDVLTGAIKKSDIIKVLDSMLPPAVAVEIMSKHKPSITHYDVIILGGGPAGLTAGLYLCQAKINTVLVDIALPGGQVSTTHQVSNYPGFIEPQPGFMLSHVMSEQTKMCGTQYKVAVDVAKVDLVNKTVVIDEFETLQAKKIIIATGASPRLLGIPGERELKGRGISYCATCDAKYFNDKEVVIIGGGNTAVEESEFISKFASKITFIHQFDTLQANKAAQERALADPKISIQFNSEPRSFAMKDGKMHTEYENLLTKERHTLVSDGVFIFIGMNPNTILFDEKLATDNWGYIAADEDMKTSIDGVFAVGDVRSKKYRQITTAVADGTIAAIVAAKEV
jgi:thioredoxin reductase (NADPH)